MDKLETQIRKQAIKFIINELEKGYNCYFSDLKDNLFNNKIYDNNIDAWELIYRIGIYDALEILYFNDVEISEYTVNDIVDFANLVYKTICLETFDMINNLITILNGEEVFCNDDKRQAIIDLLEMMI